MIRRAMLLAGVLRATSSFTLSAAHRPALLTKRMVSVTGSIWDGGEGGSGAKLVLYTKVRTTRTTKTRVDCENEQ